MFMPLKDLLCGNPVYLLLVMAISALYFVVSGLQFWITTYMNVVMGDPISEVFTYFVVTCVTAPFIGVVVSIFLFNWIGGYTSRGAYGLCLLFGFFAVLVSIPVPFAILVIIASLCPFRIGPLLLPHCRKETSTSNN